MFRTIGRHALRRGVPRQVRTKFTLPELQHIDASQGIPGLLSKQGLDVAWFQYQQNLLDRLNELTKDIPQFESRHVYEVMLATAGNPETAEIHYYAAQAYNNEFFFQGLKSQNADPSASVAPPTAREAREVDTSTELINPPPSLSASAADSKEPSQESHFAKCIVDSFDSPLAMRENMINRASAVFGNGYAWLVYARSVENMFILNTYSHASAPSSLMEQASGTPGDSQGGIVPLLNFNLWHHVYLTDYGANGKRKYLKNLANSINWETVVKRAPHFKSKSASYFNL
ncbi:small ribosomal subunit protein mS42 [Trichomonascus vanleenenianus]|uniref:small ribosomal subunit protein mS42 n=1 Tax=Trichomonascus vanleenenianus TaxID=2268995 RepID=UPI003EC9D85E